jgi:hypothetical protein
MSPKDDSRILEIVINKIHCIEEEGIDWLGTDKFYAEIVIDDGKHPTQTVKLPEPVSPAAYQSFIPLDEHQTVDINKTIYRVDDVGPYIRIGITGYDQSDPMITHEDAVIGTCQIEFTEAENWGKGTEHIAPCQLKQAGKIKSGVEIYYTIK